MRRGVIKFSLGPLSELPANFFLDSVLGFQNYETLVYIKKNNDLYTYIYLGGGGGTRKMFNLMTNESRGKVRGLSKWRKFFTRVRTKIFSLDTINS